MLRERPRPSASTYSSATISQRRISRKSSVRSAMPARRRSASMRALAHGCAHCRARSAVIDASASRTGKFALFIEERNAVVAQDPGDVGLRLDDDGIDAPPPLWLAGAHTHCNVIGHASCIRLTFEGNQC